MSFLFCGDAPLQSSGASYLCLGALPLLYPAAPPSVFDYCIVKYTAPAVALEREYVVRFMVVMFVFSLLGNSLFLMPVKFTKRYQQYFSYLCSGIKKFDYQGKARLYGQL